MLPKTRLGKRSTMGALVGSSSPTHEEREAAIAIATGCTGVGRPRHHLGLKCGGRGSDQPVLSQSYSCAQRRTDDIWPPYFSSSSSETQPNIRSVSSSIDVPRSRSSSEVDVDEMMAAMILTSLSCSPRLHSPTHTDTTAPPTDCVGGGELSDGGSSGYWSVGGNSGSPAPSPPAGESYVGSASPTDEGLEMELEQVLFEEPLPRKRRNSVKVVFRCLWPGCEKVLTSTVGIKRHIRTTHLSHDSEHEHCSRSEEDFYYTEVHQRERAQQTPPHTPPAAGSPSTPPPPLSPPLSRSAPCGSIWQVQSEHSYQAQTPAFMVASAAPVNAQGCQWAAPLSSCHNRQVLSVSVGDQAQHHSTHFRRIRGEAKKCRKVYGIEHRQQWCTACRWKKACQRFID